MRLIFECERWNDDVLLDEIRPDIHQGHRLLPPGEKNVKRKASCAELIVRYTYLIDVTDTVGFEPRYE